MTPFETLQTLGETAFRREEILTIYLEKCEAGEEHLLAEDGLPFLAHIRRVDPRLWLSHIMPVIQFWPREERQRFEQVLDSQHPTNEAILVAQSEALTEVLNPDHPPDVMAALLKDKDPAGYEWVTDEVAEQLVALAEPGFGQHRAVINEFFHRARYAVETRQQIKNMVAQKSAGRNGNIASRSRKAQEYVRTPPTPQTYQHPQIMALSGVTVLAGRPKMGKSYLALNLAIAVARGGLFLSYFPVQHAGDVLYLALEDNESRMYGRICALMGEEDPPANLWLDYHAPSLDDGVLVEEIEGWLHLPDVTTPRLIVIDIFRLVQSHRGRKDDIYELEYGDMTQLTRLAQTHGVHIIIVTHLNKSYSMVEDMADAIMSSTAITGGASGIWVLAARGEERCDAELHVSGKDIPRWSCGLQKIVLDGHMDWKALGDIQSVLQGDVKIEILITLYKWDGRAPNQTELRDALSARIEKGNFSRLLKKMRADSLIQVERSRYHLTQAGASSAEIFDNLDNDDNSDNTYNTYNNTAEGNKNQIDRGNTWIGEADPPF